MRWFYSHDYNYGRGLPLRQIHGFLLDKPRRIHDLLVQARPELAGRFEEPPPALDDDALRLVHTDRLVTGLGTQHVIAKALEFPALKWLPRRIVERAVVGPQRRGGAGTVAGFAAASEGVWVANLSGGYHHAGPDRAHGFCLINDVAIAVASHRAEPQRSPTRVLVLDLDLHQGDGNAIAFAEQDDVFTVSLHEGSAFPHPKAHSDLDVELDSYLGDADYLGVLEETLARLATLFHPTVVVYVAGTDPFAGDPLGTLTLSKEGLVERDRMVARFAKDRGAGMLVLPAGGYCAASPQLSAAGMLAIAEVELR